MHKLPSVSSDELEQWINTTLSSDAFKDYAPNGLQVQGASEINHIVTGVTASQALINKAIELNAQALLVHHGWFWKNESPCITGSKLARVRSVISHNINLFGYHLPLDAHPELGNNAQLAKVLGLKPHVNDKGEPITFGYSNLIWSGSCEPQTLGNFSEYIEKQLGRTPLVVGNKQQEIKSVAWCTGGAQGMMQDAIDRKFDVYITGEASEQNFHMARENNIAFIAAGHHATERYGVKALGELIHKTFGVKVSFIDIDNPI